MVRRTEQAKRQPPDEMGPPKGPHSGRDHDVATCPGEGHAVLAPHSWIVLVDPDVELSLVRFPVASAAERPVSMACNAGVDVDVDVGVGVDYAAGAPEHGVHLSALLLILMIMTMLSSVRARLAWTVILFYFFDIDTLTLDNPASKGCGGCTSAPANKDKHPPHAIHSALGPIGINLEASAERVTADGGQASKECNGDKRLTHGDLQ
ncbi:hypothetical protein ACJZ2D_013028 [Fusarium nematophilum]